MKRLIPIVIALALLGGLLPEVTSSLAPGFVASPAHAQDKPVRRMNLLDMIFGGALRKQRNRAPVNDPRARRVIVTPGSGAEVGSQPATRDVVDKSENAAKILVVGDFMADGLGWALEQAYAENPTVVIINAAKGLSGLVRDDVLDWPNTVPQLVAEHNPTAVVALVGMNDRQQMRTSEGRVDKLEDPWKAEYKRRVEAVVKAVRGNNVPLFWVSLVPVNSGAMNRDYLVLNEFYRSSVETAGGKYIDVWDGYTNAEGQFIVAGPDVNGQIVRLRNSDGINLTKAGKTKLAFYVERELKKIPSLANASAVAALPGLGSPGELTPQYDPAATGRTVVISLDGPMVDGGEVLEGGDDILAGGEEKASTSYELVVNGIASEPKKGRVDYAWGASGGEPEKEKAKSDELQKNSALSGDEAAGQTASNIAPTSAN